MQFKIAFLVCLAVGVAYCDSGEDHHDEHHEEHPAEHHTECQTWRQRATDRPIVGGLVPDCEENGDFKHLQCHGETVQGTHFCQCWKSDGTVVTQASTHLAECDCILAQHEARNKAAEEYHPQCHQNGTYQHRQCWTHDHNEECWCVNDHGEKLNEPTHDLEHLHC